MKTLQDVFALNEARNIVALVNSGYKGGNIDRVINQIGDVAWGSGKDVEILDNEDDLLITCRSTLQGTTNCFAAVVFYSSPDEGPDGVWNYTLRVDGSLNSRFDVRNNNNDQEVFILPLQHAVDYAIAGLNDTVDVAALPQIQEYPYTSITQDERDTRIRQAYMQSLINILGVAFFIAVCGILYQQVGLQASERELGMSQLLESMMPNKRSWEPQAARLISYHVAFTIMYLPGWILIAVILQIEAFAQTSFGVLIVFHLLAGLALSSFALFVGAFFKKAQLSGITAIIVSLVLAILAQVYDTVRNGPVIACSLLFPSMNYTYFIILMARWQAQNAATNLVKAAPSSPWTLPGIVLWILLIIQIVVYPILAALVERGLWGTSGGRRTLPKESGTALELKGFCKYYYPNWFNSKVLPLFRKEKRETVYAADDLNLAILPGQLTVLLGANGCGKSTTLDAIAGLSKPTKGTIEVDTVHGIGLCPQKNVHWSLLTVREHVKIFNKLKSVDRLSTTGEMEKLIEDCDLDRKISAKAGSLSGGQQRKLQLLMMFIGGSKLCLVDEVSSGIDPLARRKIQEILLAERQRSSRTIIFTSHYLDEADIADRIVIMSKGKIRIDGTGPQIKQSGVYRVHVHHSMANSVTPHFSDVERHVFHDQTVYTVPNAADATDLLQNLEEAGWKEYHISGPTVEDAFLQVAEEMVPATEKVKNVETDPGAFSPPSDAEDIASENSEEKELQLQTGSHIGPFRQGFVLFRKRFTVFQRNFLPNLVAFLIIPVAAGLTCLFIKHYPGAGCTPTDQVTAADVNSITSQLQNRLDVVLGPSDKLGLGALSLVGSSLGFGANGSANSTSGSGNSTGVSGTGNFTGLLNSLHFVQSLDAFNDYVDNHFHNVTPGGAFFGDDLTTIAYQQNGIVAYAFLVQNIADIIATNISIAAQYSDFDIPWQADQGNTLQFCIYLGLAMCVYPAFFALYPTLERLRNVRNLHYSNGVRALPLWLAYTGFDFAFVLVGTALAVIIFTGVTGIWFGLGQLFVVFALYGLTATLISYVVSLFARSQLAAFAFAAAFETVTLLLYMIAYLAVFTYAPVNALLDDLLIVHYTMAIIFPAASMMRALFVSLNELSTNCVGPSKYVSSPAAFRAYGAPITYLIIQSLLLFGFLVWWESGAKSTLWRRKAYREPDSEEKHTLEPEVAEELARVQSAEDDGLRVMHLTKAYGKNVAVQDVSFGIKRGEVFALLGPNGAGKSTTVSCVRGDIRPSSGSGDILIEGTSILRKKAAARQLLGNCPQFDAMDQLTVLEQLKFYARVRGVADVEANVKEVIRAVGLTKYRNRMSNSLSGGNKRKASIGIALMGNPSVMLLDEPSSGLDVAAKRIIWKTLETIVHGRSIALITHSMEEADRLCQRAGIMAGRMLAIGTSEYLRKKHGDRYHVHILLNSAPYTSDEESEKVRQWVVETFEGAEVDEKVFHGQIRFSVPARLYNSRRGDAENEKTILEDTSESEEQIASSAPAAAESEEAKATDDSIEPVAPSSDERPILLTRTTTALTSPTVNAIAALFAKLEQSKQEIGFEYYSVSQTTLDQVFLSIVGKHNVQEENYVATHQKEAKERKRRW